MTRVKMKLKRASASAPEYPSAEEIRQDRRKFLGLLARATAAVPLVGMWSCMGIQQEMYLPQDSGSQDSAADARQGDGLVKDPADLDARADRSNWSSDGIMVSPEEIHREEPWITDGLPPDPEEVYGPFPDVGGIEARVQDLETLSEIDEPRDLNDLQEQEPDSEDQDGESFDGEGSDGEVTGDTEEEPDIPRTAGVPRMPEDVR